MAKRKPNTEDTTQALAPTSEQPWDTDQQPTHPPKRKRTESPEAIAMRAHRTMRQLQERLQAEMGRHLAKTKQLQTEIEQHDAECLKLPDAARKIFEKLVG